MQVEEEVINRATLWTDKSGVLVLVWHKIKVRHKSSFSSREFSIGCLNLVVHCVSRDIYKFYGSNRFYTDDRISHPLYIFLVQFSVEFYLFPD